MAIEEHDWKSCERIWAECRAGKQPWNRMIQHVGKMGIELMKTTARVEANSTTVCFNSVCQVAAGQILRIGRTSDPVRARIKLHTLPTNYHHHQCSYHYLLKLPSQLPLTTIAMLGEDSSPPKHMCLHCHQCQCISPVSLL